MSAGAPYAYACAAGMPESVRRVAILSGVPFIHAPDVLAAYPPEGQAAYARYATADTAELRSEFRAFCQQAVVQVTQQGEISAERMSKALNAVLHYDAAGPAREAWLQALGWGFGPCAIQCPVDVWHFEADPMVPFEAVQRSANQLPDVHRHFSKGQAHIASLAMLEDMATILAE